MHREFKKLLENAHGISEFVIAVNIDVRGFSPFTLRVDSAETAMFIKTVYRKVLDKYFLSPSFFKPTGDGLLIMIPYTKETLKDEATKTVETCLTLLGDFGSLCADEHMINFEVPQRVGIGLSRGAACRLVSGDKTLDYSGRVLNLASRLMDLARPSGIVIDSEFGMRLLPKETVKKFSKDDVYIRGIAERESIGIYLTKDCTIISPLSKKPLSKAKWKTIGVVQKLRDLKKSRPSFLFDLPSEPTDPSQVIVKVEHPGVYRGRKQDSFITHHGVHDFNYVVEAGKPMVKINYDTLVKELLEAGVKDTWTVKINISYPEE